MLRAPGSRWLGATFLFVCVAILGFQTVTPAQAQDQYILWTQPGWLDITLEQGDTLWTSIIVVEDSGSVVEFWTYNSEPWLFIDTFTVAPLITPETLSIMIDGSSLAPGTYVDSIIIDTYNGINTPIAVPVVLSITGGDIDYQVVANPPLLDLDLPDGQTHVEWIDIYEIHGAFVPFDVFTTQPWISTSGYPQIPPYTTPMSLEVVFVLDAMPVGTYYDTLRIYSTDDSLGFTQVSVPISVTVDTLVPGGYLAAFPQQFDFELNEGESLTGQEFIVYEVNNEALSFWAYNYSSWLQLDTVASTPLVTPDTVFFNLFPDSLPPGFYGDTIVVISNEAVNSPLAIPVSLNILGGGGDYTVSTMPQSMYFDLDLGQIGYDSLHVFETGGNSVGFSYDNFSSWLTVELGGQGPWFTPTSLVVSANSGQMGPGTWHDSILIYPSSQVYDFPPVAVPVTMTVGQLTPHVFTAPDRFDITVAPDDTLFDLALLVYEQYGFGVPFWVETSPGQDWLQVRYPDTLGPFWYTPDSVYFDIYAAGLPAGMYVDTIVVFDPLDDTLFWQAVMVPITLYVTGEPEDFEVLTEPVSFEFVLNNGELAFDSLYVYELHNRSLGFTHTNSYSWLVVNPFEMPPLSTPLSMPVAVRTDILPQGYYMDTIWIAPSADSTAFSPVAVPVYLVVGDSAYCGDIDGNGVVNISDAVGLVNYIFLGAPVNGEICRYDSNADGTVNISDAVRLIFYIFGSKTPLTGCCP